MVMRPLRACATPGCPERVTGRYCDVHRPAVRAEDQRFCRFYGLRRWRRERAAYLRKHHLCVTCKLSHRITAASLVDHITPHRGSLALFFDQSNWQALCATCHGVKTAREVFGHGQGASDRQPLPTAQRAPVEVLRIHNSGETHG